MKRTITVFSILLTAFLIQFNAISLFAASPSSDVESTFRQGDKVFNLGLGIGSTYLNRYYSTMVPPISLSLEYAMIEDFIMEDVTLGVGGYVGYTASRFRPSTNYGVDYTYLIFGARGALHYPVVENLDTYAGLMLALNIVRHRAIGNYPGSIDGGRLYPAIFLGGRYYFNEGMAIFGELGYGVSYLTIGVAFKVSDN